MTTITATTTACRVLARLEHAWNSADGDAYGRQYTEDATFVNVDGLLATGPAAIAAGHDHIFSTIYAGSTNRMHLVEAVPVADGVIAAVSRNTLDVPAGPLAGVRQALVTSVLVGGADGWRISASQTTLVGAR
ncbi:SgcJ/EcaC family oxidoreductase [Iamia sp. SCSIO 61187]|uniref:SgcJ/EcaC family oxidoreductase n=1 Tax=Iamia sp. SCSIO 61187 TaxID=2722752 RepID=UPI001C62B234|nr:SgcJ/EcaC family oxidoreductase [Iamia sp. SCSIO 61187]QYG93584.1 SgcJ/EcaC family oxidoreductase [Iamia sp. SCSIO 61187]